MDEQTTVLIIDGHRDLRTRIARGLKARGGFRIIGHTDNPVLGAELAHLWSPDIIIADFHKTGRDQVEMVRWLREVSPASRLVIFASIIDNTQENECLQAGAYRCLLKGISMRELGETLQTVAADIRREVSERPH